MLDPDNAEALGVELGEQLLKPTQLLLRELRVRAVCGGEVCEETFDLQTGEIRSWCETLNEDGTFSAGEEATYQKLRSEIVELVNELHLHNNRIEALIDQLPQLLDLSEGSLVLFSSRRQMLDVYQGLSGELGDAILMQGDYSKQEILRRHRQTIDEGRGSVIFGLASFAEGVDLPGDYCRHVVIAKIPFAVPDSPLEAALAEWIEAQGRNAFMEIAVPDAALRLVQASGRLLRTEQDSGRVTLMDRRIITKRYGRAILDSLPPFRRELA